MKDDLFSTSDSPPKVVMLGLGPTALSALRSVSRVARVEAVLRPHDDADPVAELATDLGAEVLTDPSPAAVEALIDRHRPDCVVVSSYDRVLPASLLDRSRFVNVHYAPLPQYRGRANVNWALINGEESVGISIHVLEAGLDAGNILFQQLVPIGPTDTIGDLYAALNDLQEEHLGATVLRFLQGFEGTPQDESLATYSCGRGPDDGEIDWSATTAEIDRLIRALTDPYPGAFTYLQGKRLTVWKATAPVDAPTYVGRVPGRVIRVSRTDGTVDVLTGDGVLRLIEVQGSGSESRVPAASLIRSVRAGLGLSRAELLRRIEALEASLHAFTSTQQQDHGTQR